MTQEIVVKRIIEELSIRTYIRFSDKVLITQYLNMCYTIGYDEGVQTFINRKQVKQIKNNRVIFIYDSINAAARAINRSACTISNVLKGRSKTAGGYEWRYKL